MITSVFKKSTPLNYSLVVILILVFFFLFQIQEPSWMSSSFLAFQKVSLLCFILASFFLINFIVKKNGLSKDNGYAIFFYLLLLLFFPAIFNNPNVLYANFFILLAVRRLISLQSLKASKEKLRIAHTGMKMSDNHKENSAKGHYKAIYQIDKNTGEILQEFESVKQATEYFNGGQGTITKVLNKSNYTAFGFKWIYKIK